MIECKIRHGVQRKEQQKVQRRWEKAGGVYLLVSELSMVREFLRARGLLK